MYVDLGLMITEKCDFHCGHCMFSCCEEGKDMPVEIMERAREVMFTDEELMDGMYGASVYGGEPFLNMELFGKAFELFYTDDVPFFISSNGSFMADPVRREAVFDIMRRMKGAWEASLTSIRISNTEHHDWCRSEEQDAALKQLQRLISDPESWYEYWRDNHDKSLTEGLEEGSEEYYDALYENAPENPFQRDDGDVFIYIDKRQRREEFNPSGRAVHGADTHDKPCYCVITKNTFDPFKDEEDERLSLNVKPDGQVSICCKCDSATVGNVMEPNFTPRLAVRRIKRLRHKLRAEYQKEMGSEISNDTRMCDLCEYCINRKDDYAKEGEKAWKKPKAQPAT